MLSNLCCFSFAIHLFFHDGIIIRWCVCCSVLDVQLMETEGLTDFKESSLLRQVVLHDVDEQVRVRRQLVDHLPRVLPEHLVLPELEALVA